MTTVALAPSGFGAGYQAFNANGQVLSGGLLNTYAAGTTTPTATYTTSAGTVQNSNPIVLGVDGRAPNEIWLIAGTSYKFILTDSLSNTIGTYDNLTGINDFTVGLLGWAVAGGGADAITASYSPANTSLTDGLGLNFRASAANATTTPNFSPDGLPAHNITKKGGAVLAPGDIPGNLAECIVRYNLANTRWELENPYVLSSYKVINTTFDLSTATGATLVVTGVGFKPRFVEMQQGVAAGNAGNSFGWTDGATEMTTANYNSVGTGFNAIISTGFGQFLASAGNAQTFSIASGGSFDSDGCTIKNTKVGTPSGTTTISLKFIR